MYIIEQRIESVDGPEEWYSVGDDLIPDFDAAVAIRDDYQRGVEGEAQYRIREVED